MSSFLRQQAVAQDENMRLAGGKPAQAVDTRQVARRAFGDVGSSNLGMQAKPAATRPAFGTLVPSTQAGAGAASSSFGTTDFAYHAPELPEFDRADASVPEAVTDYVGSIYQHFRAVESIKQAKHGYMAQQTDINEKMRAILIDWLVEVHLKFKLMPETMYLTVNLIDRYLELKVVQRTKLQLVGVTAMLLASKYEEIYAPEVRDFVYITDKAYTKEEILRMEASMLNTLAFKVTVPTGHVFLQRFAKVAGVDKTDQQRLMATYIMERTLQEYSFLKFLPSKIAAACMNMTVRTVRGRHGWDTALTQHTGYAQEDLREVVEAIQGVLQQQPTSNLKAVWKKYSNPKFGEVAAIAFAPLE